MPASANGSSATFTTLVAPVFRAKSSRSLATSVTVTSVAPEASATCIASSPMGPAPVTSTRSPALTPAFRQDQMPTESGSISAPALSDNSSGSVKAKSSWIVT